MRMMTMRSSCSRGRLTVVLSVLALWLGAGAASATTFSFGTIEPTDQITSIIVAPSAGDSTYTASDGSFVIDAYISTINFANRAPIAITPGDVTFSSQLTLSNELLLGPQFDIALVTGVLTNGLASDFTITDIPGGIVLLGGDFDTSMSFTAAELTNTVSADLTADIGDSLVGDADFLAAFGPAASIDLKVILGAGDICSTIADCPPVPFQTPPAVLIDFAGPTNGTIIPIPEPSTAFLVTFGILALTHRARAQRMNHTRT